MGNIMDKLIAMRTSEVEDNKAAIDLAISEAKELIDELLIKAVKNRDHTLFVLLYSDSDKEGNQPFDNKGLNNLCLESTLDKLISDYRLLGFDVDTSPARRWMLNFTGLGYIGRIDSALYDIHTNFSTMSDELTKNVKECTDYIEPLLVEWYANPGDKKPIVLASAVNDKAPLNKYLNNTTMLWSVISGVTYWYAGRGKKFSITCDMGIGTSTGSANISLVDEGKW